jgi:hypothetical protein
MMKKRKFVFWFIAILILLLNITTISAETIFVAHNATGANNGTSWTDAYTSLHSALNTAESGDEIWVAAGVYYATSSFELSTGVEVYGGFVGTETLLTERDWQLNKTILSGDIGQDDLNTDGNFITESWEQQVGTNTDHVVVAQDGLDSTARLDGFIVTAGSATTNYGGGGILNWNSSPSYYNLEIKGNQGSNYGGGMLNISSSPHVENVLIEGNRVNSASTNHGGGMNNLYDGSPNIINVIFNNNQASQGGGYACGEASPYFEDVIFSNNIGGYGGGAYFSDGATPTLNSVTFIKNQSYMGGGIYSFRNGTLTLTNVDFIENIVFDDGTLNRGGGLATNNNITINAVNVSFIGNTAADSGGGADFSSGSTANLTNGLFLGNNVINRIGGGLSAYNATVTINNATFNGNLASSAGGGIGVDYYGNNITATNSIVWGNYPEENQVYSQVPDTYINMIYSNIQQESGVYAGTGNINSDPRFIEPAEPLEAPSTFGDLRINGFSPCVNSGENSYNDETSDIRGQARIQNTTIDMGAYEWTDGIDPAFQVIYVDYQAVGNDDGSSWDDAYLSFQSALDEAASGDQIWVAKGIYNPSIDYEMGGGSRYYHFRIDLGVEIYGGFAGSETALSQRNNFGYEEVNETILSGDLNGNDDFDVANGGYQGITGDDNCYHVFYHPDGWNISNASILDGFTITGGNANGASNPHNRAGGLYAFSSSPTIRNVVFTSNSATSLGGAVYIYNSASEFSNVSFLNNISDNAGAMYLYSSNSVINNAIFSGNISTTDGGALSTHSASPTITNALFSSNTAENNGGAIIFYSNSVQFNTILNNVTLSDNHAGNSGGGIRFASNNAASTLTINNSIIWDNLATNSGNELSLISAGSTTMNYSCYKNQTNDVELLNGTFTATNNNITSAPLFVDATAKDFKLFGTSPTVNSGLNSYNNTLEDVRGQARIQNTVIDMGAYEWTEGVDPYLSTGSIIYVDVNASGTNTGLNWSNAFTSLQSGLNHAISGNQIWAAKCIYNPSYDYELGGSSRFYHFRMVEGVEIYGGFSGTETSIDERINFGMGETNETILSGDLNGDDIVTGSGETLTFSNNSENCYHVIYNPEPLTSASVLNGFTVKGGHGNGAEPYDRGPGIFNSSASPSLTNVTFTANKGVYGGGICNYMASPIVTNCLIFGNKTSNSAGIENSTSSSPTIINTTISMNVAANYAGGMMNYNNCSPILQNCIIWGNIATTGNQIYITGGGTTTLNYSCYSNSTNDVVVASGSFGTNFSITVEPVFADASNEDFRLFGNSPPANTGLNSYNSTTTDIRGQSRIQNTTIDMGAYEWTSGIDPIGLNMPQSLTIERTEISTILNWTAVSGALSYNVYRSVNPNSGFELIDSTVSTTYEDNESLSGNTYFYYVKASTEAKSKLKKVQAKLQ